MTKLVLFIALLTMTQQSITANNLDNESKDTLEWVYWNTFSETFIKTSDVLKSESAALEAEDEAEEIINTEQWLAEIDKQESTNEKPKSL